ncbi:MAG: hypothetical protein AVDCRST_MAG68-1608, partial [uncultured Gemmatimonadetes bacterium]
VRPDALGDDARTGGGAGFLSPPPRRHPVRPRHRGEPPGRPHALRGVDGHRGEPRLVPPPHRRPRPPHRPQPRRAGARDVRRRL